MALDIDTSSALRRPRELTALVRAIEKAHDGDESDWLEWKSDLDLGAATGRIHVARAVLGLANRPPERAAAHCDGVGYVVVGVEPGNLGGATPVDPAALDDGLSPYLGGAKGPSWNPTWVPVDGVHVLVVAVEAPRWGDGIFTLRKAFDSTEKGTIFVRKPGKTGRADDADVEALERRGKTGHREPLKLDVRLMGETPIAWFDPSATDAEVEAWIDERVAHLIREAQAIEDARNAPSEGISLDQIQKASGLTAALSSQQAVQDMVNNASGIFSGITEEKDTRTFEEYEDEVKAWADRCRERVSEALPALFLEGRNMVRIAVENSTDRNLAEVQIRIAIPGEGLTGLYEPPEEVPLPAQPWKFGKSRKVNPLGGFASPELFSARLSPDIYSPGPVAPSERLWIENGSIKVTWNVGDLRPFDLRESGEIFILLTNYPSHGELTGTWQATSKSLDGVAEDGLVLQVQEQPVTAGGLLTSSQN